MKVNRDVTHAGDPAYMRIADSLERKLRRSVPGTPMASEHELASVFAVSRLTARAALDELERRYLVRRSKGRRTEVARRIEYRIGPNDAPSWSEAVRAVCAQPRTETVALRRKDAPSDIRHALALGPTAPTAFLARRRYVDDELVAYAETWLPEELVPGLAQVLAAEASLYASLRDTYHMQPVRGWTRAEFVVAPKAVADRLQMRERPMMIQLEGTTDSRALRRPVERTTSWLRADVFRVLIDLELAG